MRVGRFIRKLVRATDTNGGRAVMATTPAATTRTARVGGRDVPVTTSNPAVDLDRVLACVPFTDWAASFSPALECRSVSVTDVDYFGPRVGFLKFTADVCKDGVPIPGIVFMRGGAVAILPVLVCEGARFVLCCRQPRVPVGAAAFLEIPAGMLDGDGHFAGVAAKELQEETGLVIAADSLVDLTALAYGLPLPPTAPPSNSSGSGGGGAGTTTDAPPQPQLRGMYPSVGGCDEFLRLLYFRRDVTRAELDALRGKATGKMEEGELITLEVVPYEALWRAAPDAKTLASLLLLERLQAEGAVPR
jgi:ADP-sugar diphosphatase